VKCPLPSAYASPPVNQWDTWNLTCGKAQVRICAGMSSGPSSSLGIDNEFSWEARLRAKISLEVQEGAHC